VLSWKIGIRELRGDRMKMEAPIKELDAVCKREKLDACFPLVARWRALPMPRKVTSMAACDRLSGHR
jgi:hypothetical protein